ncbi:MAG: M14 family metallocarboxypeptidase [Gammaproteobacteria bacterium]|nr:M14 family metallocarboxypeptidase [Gammaproteobacteria bacterium]
MTAMPSPPRLLTAILALTLGACAARAPSTADGRLTVAEVQDRVAALGRDHGWAEEIVYRYPGDDAPLIRAWRTPQRGPALWILAGIHGEEPAGPNAVARSVPAIATLAATGVPMVVVPLANPRAYARNWRYPNTPERDWRGPGYSVGDSEYLLPDLADGTSPRAAQARGPETQAFTTWVMQLGADYPPLLALDLHEDELSMDGGYVYIQAPVSGVSAVADEVVRLLSAAGMPLRMSGTTRFGEPVENGLSTRDAEGKPFRDGSVDELLSAPTVFVAGKPQPGPNGPTVLVVETPAFAAARLADRVRAQAAVLESLAELWRLAGQTPLDLLHAAVFQAKKSRSRETPAFPVAP